MLPIHGRRRLIVALLMILMVISALDKLIFAFAGVQIIDDLNLTPEQFGLVASAFFFLYSLSGVLVGFLANRCETRWILVGMSVVWTAAQLLVTFTHSLAAMMASRLLLGAGTGPATAISQHACFKWFAPRERVLPSSLLFTSILLGGLIGSVLLPVAITQLGWRDAYLALALLSVAWMIAWLLVGREGSEPQVAMESVDVGPSAPYRKLLLNPTFLCATMLGFLCYVPSAMSFSWTVVYLNKGLGLTSTQAGVFMLASALLSIVLSLGLSSLSQRALKRGASTSALVLPPVFSALLGGGAFALMAVMDSQAFILPLLFLGAGLTCVMQTFGLSIIAHFSPPERRAAMLALFNAGQTSAGMVIPALVGQLVALLGNDIGAGVSMALSITGALTVLAALLGLRLIRPEAERVAIEAYVQADRQTAKSAQLIAR